MGFWKHFLFWKRKPEPKIEEDDEIHTPLIIVPPPPLDKNSHFPTPTTVYYASINYTYRALRNFSDSFRGIKKELREEVGKAIRSSDIIHLIEDKRKRDKKIFLGTLAGVSALLLVAGGIGFSFFGYRISQTHAIKTEKDIQEKIQKISQDQHASSNYFLELIREKSACYEAKLSNTQSQVESFRDKTREAFGRINKQSSDIERKVDGIKHDQLQLCYSIDELAGRYNELEDFLDSYASGLASNQEENARLTLKDRDRIDCSVKDLTDRVFMLNERLGRLSQENARIMELMQEEYSTTNSPAQPNEYKK